MPRATAAPQAHDWAERRERVRAHFDEGSERWTTLTSDAPVSRIRRTVREGRAEMRATLRGWLPEDVSGLRILDAGCGPGDFALALAAEGAHVTGVDIAAELVEEARRRAAEAPALPGSVEWAVGDLRERLREGEWDHVVSMDCFIHYPLEQTLETLADAAEHTRGSMAITVAPWTALLAAMQRVGSFFPRRDRAPGIIPVRHERFLEGLAARVPEWAVDETHVVHRGFYISRGLRLTPHGGRE